MAQNTSGSYKVAYLNHDMYYRRPGCPPTQYVDESINNVIQYMANYQDLEICIFVRGVDPFSAKQTIKYDLSRIFGNLSYGSIEVEGSYYLNIPIQGQNTAGSTIGIKPASHVTGTNNASNLYFESFTFTPDSTQYQPFNSTLPYYYLSTDDPISFGYNPYSPSALWNSNSGSLNLLTETLTNGKNLPVFPNSSFYVVGGSYMRWDTTTDFDATPFSFTLATNSTAGPNNCDQDCQRGQYYNYNAGNFIENSGSLTMVYSPAYYRQNLPAVNFTNSSRIVMRSDRLPTSTGIENGIDPDTGYALHQNNNFAVYSVGGVLNPPVINAGGDLAGGESFDDDPTTQALTSTLSCEGMVPLACYTGSGADVGVVAVGTCSVPENRMINGCYCLLNKKYVKEYKNDANLFLEWKVRFTLNFAACRGVFAQVFQNNWVNGVLYMFNFNKNLRVPADSQQTPYTYCEDVIVFDDLTNAFYYRSSPWNGSDFIGKNPPGPIPFLPSTFEEFPGYGYNEKQIQFPTTVVDLGPRDFFINQVCCSGGDSGFGSYYANQLTSTSYQDNSDIIQLGFLSRILNQGVRQRNLPITVGQNSSEGQGIQQFFNSTREGYRIDGDWAQMLSINSEWKVSPFITENLPATNPNDYIFFGDNYWPANPPSGAEDIKPVMGLFFQTTEEGLRYRKIESPGIETYSYTPLIENIFGYPKSQTVPFYKWSIKSSAGPNQNIFGSEDNNWYTNSNYPGFFTKEYQNLNFVNTQEKYIANQSNFGYIYNQTNAGIPQPAVLGVVQGAPAQSGGLLEKQNAILVGAPYHFYFGLNNGKTALDRFYKLYVATSEE